MKEIQTQLIGSLSLPTFIAAMLFALLGFILFKLLTLDLKSPKTPEKFSFKYWLIDNYKELLLTGIGIFVFVRFAHESLSYFLPDISPSLENYNGMFIYFMLGLLFGKIINAVRKMLRKN